MLLDEESQSLANLSDFMNKRVTLQAESQYAREVFDIVLI
jgi:ribonuclease G